MSKYKILNLLVLLTLVFSLFMSGNDQVIAQTTTPPGQDKKDKVTQADREAAAARAAADGFTLEASAVTAMAMDGMSAAPRYFSHPNYANSPLPRNVVADWNAIAQDILQPPVMDGMSMGGISMSTAFVYLSYMQAAVYDVLVAIEGGYQPYAYFATPNPTASVEAAVAAAAYGVLNNYVPSLTLTGIYDAMVAAVPDSVAKSDGIAIGQAAAAAIIAKRTADGLLAPNTYSVPAPGIGVWEQNVMNGTLVPPVDPWMAQLTPFLRLTSDHYRPPAPYDLTSPEYAADLNEVKEIGGAGSLVRTTAQTEVATFWTDNMVIMTNSAYRQVAESRGLNLIETARLMAMGNMVATDSLIFTFDSKYTYNFWRPVAAIRNADVDDNDATTGDATWMPALPTPNFPEYVAGHGSFVSSQAELFTQLFGTQIELDLSSRVTGTTRHFATAADMRTEIINARTWGGMHFRTSSELAVATGQQLVLDAVTSYFLADPLTNTMVHATVAGGIRKFVDTLPGLTAANANNLGKYIPVAEPEVRTYNGIEADYYEIAVVQYEEKLHSDLPPTLLRGYVQLSTTAVSGEHVQLTNTLLDGTVVEIAGSFGVTPPHYLGPTIVATKDRPVRIKFVNLLPTGVDGNLFIPVDTTVMGSGMGQFADMTMDTNPQIPMCDMEVITADCYTENRATLHLHGGISPWISDGTPHQWVTPAGENTPYPEGVSVEPVPDMSDSGDPNDGVMTFYYTNQQSARLMFYHDHAWGITRLNVYAGEAAPYIITDDTEKALLNAGLIPGADSTIPLVIQDKTFVPSVVQIAEQDETWNFNRWGSTGDLWLPHVYSPAQNPGDVSGVNQFGRWAYGPWFWPPTIGVENGPIPNPYYDINCNPEVQWCEPPLMPGVPFNSMGMEAFMDTPVVNGTAYPTLEVDPKSYRFRILNAANDRFFNLSLYKAIDAAGNLCDLSVNPTPAPESTGVACTEVALADVAAALADPTVFPTPAGNEGPEWIQIGTEGGFLPAPAVFPAHPTTWVNDPTVFNAGNVDLHSLLIAPAERADVVVDFSAFAGQTLILYNDAPAAFPARDPRYDYYTGNGDYRDTGGAPSTLAGYGPNTRTVMRIVVAPAAPAPAFGLTSLENAFKAKSLGGLGVFESGQHPIIVGQGAYNSAYGTSFQNNGPMAGLAQIFDTSLTFKTLSGNVLTMPFQPKMIQDEMGEAFEQEYGRMSGNLGVEAPNPQAGNQNMILYGFTSPPTEIINGVELPPGVSLTPISTTDDGTQIWKFTHNGVDTHPVHFHLYDVQLLNRVGWDGIIRKPEANELGWKDTVRVSPLEDTIVALRPLIPEIPWDIPNSIRLLDPSMPDGAVIASSTQAEAAGLVPMAFDPTGEPIDIFNHYVNFGWEYVMHCHILSHEEMDMMRPVAVGVAPKDPSDLTAVRSGNGNNRRVTLTWKDNSLNDTSFTVERALTASGPWTPITFLQSPLLPSTNTTMSFIDQIGNTNTVFFYRVFASNTIGDTWDYSDPNLNEGASFPTLNLDSLYSNVATFGSTAPSTPAAPSNLSASLQTSPQALLTWTDNSTNESGFVIERSVNGGVFSVLGQVGTGIVSFTDTTISAGSTFTYRVKAVNSAGSSAYSNTASVSLAVPAAPSNLTAGSVRKGNNVKVTLTWLDNANNENGFTLQWATDAAFTNILSSASVAVNATTFTTPNLSRGTAYYFRIQSFNASGTSTWVNATPFPINTP